MEMEQKNVVPSLILAVIVGAALSGWAGAFVITQKNHTIHNQAATISNQAATIQKLEDQRGKVATAAKALESANDQLIAALKD